MGQRAPESRLCAGWRPRGDGRLVSPWGNSHTEHASPDASRRSQAERPVNFCRRRSWVPVDARKDVWAIVSRRVDPRRNRPSDHRLGGVRHQQVARIWLDRRKPSRIVLGCDDDRRRKLIRERVDVQQDRGGPADAEFLHHFSSDHSSPSAGSRTSWAANIGRSPHTWK